ncbi:MAG: GGDEF domain-containing protein [Clostridia bacterium]|nr:GGDEF domain-containing protein [Clostridia bacterium]
MRLNADSAILRFFRDDIGGNLITDASGAVVYADEKSAFIGKEKTNWAAACPPAREGQRSEAWDLLRQSDGKTYMVITSTFSEGGELFQIHHLVDTSLYMDLFRDITDYSKALKVEKEHDGLTGLYNKGKFMELKTTLFRTQNAIVVFNMDVNNLKHMNDTYGHEAGDRLIKKAAESLKRIEARNVIPFRVGGDEFVVVALHMRRPEAEALRRKWAEGLRELNRVEDGIECEIACGAAYGDAGYDLEAVLAEADRRMYEDKLALKAAKAGKAGR